MSADPFPRDGSDYDDLLLVEAMETLLEELEEVGIEGSLDDASLTTDLREQIEIAAVHSTGELRAKIEKMHRRLDVD